MAPLHRMLVVHNIPSASDPVRTIELKPFRKFAFGSLLAYGDNVEERLSKERMQCSSLALPGGVAVYGKAQLQGIEVGEKYGSILCHLVLDHGGVVADDFFSALRADFLASDGTLLNPVKSITKNDVARSSRFELETQTAPCVIKKNDNYNRPETVLRVSTQAELDAWRNSTTPEERSQYVVHKLLRYFGIERSRMHQLERWIVLFDDLTVNHRCSDEFFIKRGTSLSYYVRDERCMADDLHRLAESGYDWKGRSIDCSYDNDSDAWDARYAALKHCRDAFGFDYAELDVMQPSKHEFVVIDVNHTPGPSYKNVYWRELAVRLLAERLEIRPKKEEESPRTTQRLEEELARNPDDASRQFQIAESYRDAGRLQQARAAYTKRALMAHGSGEERFVAQLEAGRISMRLEAFQDVVLGEMLAAYCLRPKRAEPLYELARYFRIRNLYAMATLFAKAGVQTPRPDDDLRVVESVYTWQMLDELGAAAYEAGDYACAKGSWEAVITRAQGGVSIPSEDLERIHECLARASRQGTSSGAP